MAFAQNLEKGYNLATRSLNQGIFRLVIGLVLLTSLTILVNLWVVTYQQAQIKLDKEIQLAQKILGEVLQNQEELLLTSASVLTEDFGFKQAVASKDSATINSALFNHGARISADLMAIFSLDGQTITSTNEQLGTSPNKHSEFDETAANKLIIAPTFLQETLVEGGVSTFLTVNQKIYKIIILRIDAPSPIALAMVGFELDSAFIEQLESTTQIQVRLHAISQRSTSPEIWVESENRQSLPIASSIRIEDLDWFHIVFANTVSVTQNFALYQTDTFSIEVTLTQSLKELIAEFSTLKSSISIIIIVSALFAFAVAALYSRRLAKPISELATIAQRISAGNYEQIVTINTHTKEFSHLSHAFTNMQSSIQEREKQITYQAQHDTLTGLFTRNHTSQVIDHMLGSNSSAQNFQAVAINIQGFRDINDVFGYQNGDQCLVEIARRLRKLGGTAARLSGGEFLWIPSIEASARNTPINLSQLREIKQTIEKTVIIKDVTISFAVAMGIVNCPSQASSAELLFKRTNIVLDEAQLQTSLMLEYAPELEQKYVRRVQIMSRLKRALMSNSSDLALYYQPKLHLSSQRVNAAEALIRWNDAELGFVPPDEFIGIAEHAGLIQQVTQWVIRRAIKDAKIMADKDINLSIAINLSAKDISTPYLLESIRCLLLKEGLSSDALSFEVTESALVEDPVSASEYLKEFKQQGYELAIDDFGTGYSSLAYLKSLPVDTLKIDKSFVLQLSENKDDQDIVETILQLASKFNLTVVAEGVEDKKSLQMLADMGCTWAQGFYLCRPIGLDDFTVWMHTNETKEWLLSV